MSWSMFSIDIDQGNNISKTNLEMEKLHEFHISTKNMEYFEAFHTRSFHQALTVSFLKSEQRIYILKHKFNCQNVVSRQGQGL